MSTQKCGLLPRIRRSVIPASMPTEGLGKDWVWLWAVGDADSIDGFASVSDHRSSNHSYILLQLSTYRMTVGHLCRWGKSFQYWLILSSFFPTYKIKTNEVSKQHCSKLVQSFFICNLWTCSELGLVESNRLCSMVAPQKSAKGGYLFFFFNSTVYQPPAAISPRCNGENIFFPYCWNESISFCCSSSHKLTSNLWTQFLEWKTGFLPPKSYSSRWSSNRSPFTRMPIRCSFTQHLSFGTGTLFKFAISEAFVGTIPPTITITAMVLEACAVP